MRSDGSQESMEELCTIKWPGWASYVNFVARIIFAFSKYNDWDDYESGKSR